MKWVTRLERFGLQKWNYPVYAPEIYEAYMAHRELMKTSPRQKTMPMFTNRNRTRSTGVYEAMTVKSYTHGDGAAAIV